MAEQRDDAVRGASQQSAAQPITNEISLIELVNAVLRHRRMVVGVPFLVFLVVVGAALMKQRTFTATASFVPEVPSGQESLTSSLAAQFGLPLPGGDGGQSAAFYAYLIRSREILAPLVDTTFAVGESPDAREAPLVEWFETPALSPRAERERTLDALRDRIAVNTNRETGLVTLSVRTAWPKLSYLVAQAVLDHTSRFNLERRRSKAGAERQFVESRRAAAEAELREAEDALQQFLQNNRRWRGAPELEFIHDRLQRDVVMRQEIFTTLAVAHDRARIDEVRDTPVFTVVEQPEIPGFPDRRYLIATGLLALIVGGALGSLAAFGREFLTRGRTREADEYERLKAETLRDLRRPWRLLIR